MPTPNKDIFYLVKNVVEMDLPQRAVYKQILMGLYELSKETIHSRIEWIRVENNLPDNNSSVFYYCPDFHESPPYVAEAVLVGRCEFTHNDDGSNGRYWVDCYGGGEIKHVTHWTKIIYPEGPITNSS